MAAERRTNGERTRVRENFFGRSRGKTLRPLQAGLLREALPPLALDLSRAAPADLRTLFLAPVETVRLEIGFGGGEHLHLESGRHPTAGFIGVEPFVNSMAKMLVALEEGPRANLRLFGDDATLLLDWLPDASLDGIDLFYPDPWPKRKHWKRRFVNPRTLQRMARVLKPGGRFRFASDIETYVDWTLQHLRDHPAFAWEADGPADWHTPYEGWPGTRYEAKAHREGRKGAYLTFRRL
ncbi:tRNA (guanine(46)-N(7))-methyltransferase TrmB [Aureimonas phyllosphaerae]|uniref:tRNA (guanine-N(7)-)-methyltransferase n=1 Tax=Aureimonas phyllosphaerae TaxID=1166078 RepID=A0A7W6C146_9HYPH|nr:tRNA (guanosine(46)-N(7))-methyltransferase TrmB [Aureimonas phyllosphaerae]MBB3937481.1 tRNA (guanine-N7-)-methyltransferase [Aureimonas phyllosphaerae]MBB3961453.1 tRNA (guanine-N7-)-methyltransferase [Aureimonas phyllosphaerae]SFF38326.1 tRNA (guanine-N7-)-methyltransferase [Aureimonas phyllosphaerae]